MAKDGDDIFPTGVDATSNCKAIFGHGNDDTACISHPPQTPL